MSIPCEYIQQNKRQPHLWKKMVVQQRGVPSSPRDRGHVIEQGAGLVKMNSRQPPPWHVVEFREREREDHVERERIYIEKEEGACAAMVQGSGCTRWSFWFGWSWVV